MFFITYKEEDMKDNYNIRFGYCRCSHSQTKNDQDITRQINELIKVGVLEENIVYEFISGTKEKKPKLMELLDKCNVGDTIVCCELSRLSRSFKDFFDTLQILKDKKLRLELLINGIVVDFSKDKLDPFTTFFLNIIMSFNSLEVEVTRKRIKSGIENSRKKGVRLGRPTLTKDDIPLSFYKNLDLYNNKKINKSEFARVMNWCRPKLDRILKLNSSD